MSDFEINITFKVSKVISSKHRKKLIKMIDKFMNSISHTFGYEQVVFDTKIKEYEK